MKIKPQFRTIDISTRAPDARGDLVDEDERTIELSFSSEEPVERFFGDEILSHEPGSARLDRLNSGAPVLFNHRLDQLRGVVVENTARIGKDKRGHVTIRFARDEAGEHARQLVNDGILRNVSFMYRVHDWEQTKAEAEADRFRVTDWEPLEVSLVTVPADQSVGIGRMAGRDFPLDEIDVKVRAVDDRQPQQRTDPMDPITDTAAAAAATPAEPDPAGDAQARIQAGRQELGEDFARQQEEKRIKAIRQLGATNNIPEDTVQSWITKGTSFERIADDILEIHKMRGEENPTSASRLDLTGRETRKYSLARAILAAHEGKWDNAGFELECHEAIAQRTNKIPSKGAFFVPLEVQKRELPVSEQAQRMLMQRDLSVGTAGAGGYLVQTSVMGFDELLRNLSVMFRMGAMRLSGLRDTITIPRQSAAATAAWLATEASAITESQQTFVQLSMSPKTVGAYTELSRQLLLQSTIDVEGLVNSDLASVCALAVDAAALNGDGTGGAPTGLDNTSGVGAVAGASFAYADGLEFQTDVAAANVEPIAGGYVTTPAVAAIMMQRARFANTDTPLWEGNIWRGNMIGFPAMSSNQVAAATMYFGDWSKAVIGEWGVLEVETNPFANFPAGIIGVRAMYSVDVGIRLPAAFSIGTSIS